MNSVETAVNEDPRLEETTISSTQSEVLARITDPTLCTPAILTCAVTVNAVTNAIG